MSKRFVVKERQGTKPYKVVDREKDNTVVAKAVSAELAEKVARRLNRGERAGE